jgi:hypothetical protein
VSPWVEWPLVVIGLWASQTAVGFWRNRRAALKCAEESRQRGAEVTVKRGCWGRVDVQVTWPLPPHSGRPT